MSDYNKKEIDSQIQRTNQRLPVREEREEGQDREMGLRGANYSVQNKQVTRTYCTI